MKKLNLNLYTISPTKVFIFLSFLGTLAFYFFGNDAVKFGLNSYYLNKGNIFIFFFQIFISNFLHGGFFHFLFNSIFLYYFGTILELSMGRKKFLLFFIFVAIFNSIFIIYFNGNTTTIGISGFCMALLSYYTLDLKFKNNPEYTGGITAIILNVIIGFVPGFGNVSMIGHLFGAIAGIIYYFLINDILRKKMIGVVK